MFSFLRKKNKATEPEAAPEQVEAPAEITPAAQSESEADATAEAPSKTGLFGRLKQGLSRTSNKLTEGFASLSWAEKPLMMTCWRTWKPSY